MNVQATHALVGAGIPYRGVRGNSNDATTPGARPESIPVEQVIEGELLGRQRARVEATAELFDVRLHRHATGDPGEGHRADHHHRAAVDAYLRTAAGAALLHPGNRLDIYA